MRSRSFGSARPCASKQSKSRRRWNAKERGVALILVLGSLTILTVMLTEFQDDTASELSNALSERDALKAEYAAKSAINLARLLIASEPTIRKAMAPLFLMTKSAPPQVPVWEFGDQVLGAFNDKSGADRFKDLSHMDIATGKNLGFGVDGAGFEVTIVDEDSMINLNAAARGDAFSENRVGGALVSLIGGPQYDQMFQSLDADGQLTSRQDICSAIVDWVDPDSEMYGCDPYSGVAQATGQEDSYYQLLKDPYPRKNAAFDSLEELRMVRGISDDFWNTFVEPNPDDPHGRTVTIWGKGSVNVNTANAQTILALVCANALESPLCQDPAQALQFMSTLNLVRGFTAGVPIFSSAKGFVAAMKGSGMIGQLLASIGVPPVKFRSDNEVQKTVTTESKVFSIVATGYVKQQKRETRVKIQAVVDFRGAPDPLKLDEVSGESLAQGASGISNANVKLPDGATDEAIAGAFRPDPAGTVIYFHFN
jgi:general secretion pathway protein K